MRESDEDEQDFDLGATLYRPLSQGIDNVLELYNSEDVSQVIIAASLFQSLGDYKNSKELL